jgi:hypothetical protein
MALVHEVSIVSCYHAAGPPTHLEGNRSRSTTSRSWRHATASAVRTHTPIHAHAHIHTNTYAHAHMHTLRSLCTTSRSWRYATASPRMRNRSRASFSVYLLCHGHGQQRAPVAPTQPTLPMPPLGPCLTRPTNLATPSPPYRRCGRRARPRRRTPSPRSRRAAPPGTRTPCMMIGWPQVAVGCCACEGVVGS